jgi:hypothetical protein
MWQPWASLWVVGDKEHETRHWPTHHRGWLLVHAAKRPPTVEERAWLAEPLREAGLENGPFPLGAIIGAVYIDACVPCDAALRVKLTESDMLCGDFSDGRFAWRRALGMELDRPIPFIGRQRFFEVPTSAIPAAFASLLENIEPGPALKA